MGPILSVCWFALPLIDTWDLISDYIKQPHIDDKIGNSYC